MHQQLITRRRLPTRTLTLALAAALVVLAAACLPGADDQPKSGAGTGTGILHAVRAANHTEENGYDRVVFEFVEQLPAWDVRYAPKPLVLSPSGLPAPLDGAEAIVVRFQAAYDLYSGDARAYQGPFIVTPGTPEVAQLRELQDFEGVVTWAIGVNHHRAFRASTLPDPPRLVIDVATS